jgi:SAM-dependent methyltransferase
VTAAWADGPAYESFMGRWSRLVAPQFLRRLPPRPAATWCDVGTGTGALAHAVLATEAPELVVGFDPSPAFLAAASRCADPRLRVAAGSAVALPARDRRFDRVVAALVLNFVPDPDRALAELRRVARPGAVVGAYVWDYAGGMQLLSAFWDAAAALDPAADARDEGLRFPLCRPEPLRALFTRAGLTAVDVSAVRVEAAFADLDEVWRPFLGGQGPAGAFTTALPPDRRTALRELLRERLPDPLVLGARAWVVVGRVP